MNPSPPHNSSSLNTLGGFVRFISPEVQQTLSGPHPHLLNLPISVHHDSKLQSAGICTTLPENRPSLRACFICSGQAGN